MADPTHVAKLRMGVHAWNEWRQTNTDIVPDLSGLDLGTFCSPSVDLVLELGDSREDRSGTVTFGTGGRDDSMKPPAVPKPKFVLTKPIDKASPVLFKYLANGERVAIPPLLMPGATPPDFTGANFRGANLRWSVLSYGNLRHTDFTDADLNRSSLRGADCAEATFLRTNLKYCSLVGTNIARAVFSESLVYGASVWNVSGTPACQRNIVVTHDTEPAITVDSLEVAQFIYLLLNNDGVKHVLDTITSKVVLILGRFTPERKAILDAIRDELRKRDYLPVLFDFEKPANRDITETVSTLAHMARFVIADITDAKSIPQELMKLVPALPSVPVQPLLLASQKEYGMFEHFRRFPWVLEPYVYEDQNSLLAVLNDAVIGPAEALAKRQTGGV